MLNHFNGVIVNNNNLVSEISGYLVLAGLVLAGLAPEVAARPVSVGDSNVTSTPSHPVMREDAGIRFLVLTAILLTPAFLYFCCSACSEFWSRDSFCATWQAHGSFDNSCNGLSEIADSATNLIDDQKWENQRILNTQTQDNRYQFSYSTIDRNSTPPISIPPRTNQLRVV